MNKLGIVLAIGMGAVLILAIVYAVQLFMRLSGGTAMGVHGWTAMILGVVFATALGVGLMFLIFYSNRKGYDEIERD